MTAEQREKLLSLHRKAITALEKVHTGGGHPTDFKAYYAADDAFRDFLFSLEVSA